MTVGYFAMDRKITALKIQQRNPNRVNIFLDGEFAFGLARIVAAWLRVGQALSESDIAALQNKDTYEKAYLKALNLLGTRTRSEYEVSARLVKAGFSEEVISDTIHRLKQNGMLGDQQFAAQWIENRITFRPRSHRALSYELRQKGVNAEIITESLSDITGDEALAYQAAKRYLRRLQGLEWQDFRRRLSSHLAQRGFSFAVTANTVKKIWSELKNDIEATNHEE